MSSSPQSSMSPLIATPAFLTTLTALFPANSTLPNPALWVAGIVFAAHSLPSEVAEVYTHAVNSTTCAEEKKNTTRVFREALFKTGNLYGAPRMINSLLEVRKTMDVVGVPDEAGYRDHDMPVEKLNEAGVKMFNHTYGEGAADTRELLRGVHPDFDYFMMSLIYGPINAFLGVIDAAQTSIAMIAALIAIEAPLQVGWHEAGAIRNGASKEDVEAVKQIAEKCLMRIKEAKGEKMKS
ncbi:hypothetical protein FN846DRAFT_977475 [Sphaerosporella brunnea]|uniref:AhpD-like protein n=1 Tax=Sphaerosporella brunnea TaxID=1250544 RepID=A0A5J5EFR9_9PEZI|nr:hypothetical protein FN846DRAFT_977475 [Sphaerosporella brunnea]